MSSVVADTKTPDAAAAPSTAAAIAAVADVANPVKQAPTASAKSTAGAAEKKKSVRKKDGVPISRRKEYTHFRASVPLQRGSVGTEGKQWMYYEIVSKNDPNPPAPLVMLGGTSATADLCFPQLLALGYRGYRVVSAQWPAYWSIAEWVNGLHQFITTVLKTKKAHLFGASLGGYLALHYTAAHPDVVESLALCNAFCDTTPFHQTQNCLKMFKYLPEFYLKKYILESFPTESEFPEVIDFVVEQLETMNSDDLGSRLMLNCTPARLPHLEKFDQKRITMIDSIDDIVLPPSMRDALYKRFATAKFAQMKSGGDFPYLANPEEVTMLLQVHLRAHGVFPDLHSPGAAGSSAAAAPSAATATAAAPADTKKTEAQPFLKLTSPLVIAKPPATPPPMGSSPARALPAALAGAANSEAVGGSATAVGAAAAPAAAPQPQLTPAEAAAAAAKKAAEDERLRELKEKHAREAAERNEREAAERKRVADEQKRIADEQKRAADEEARARAEDEQRRKQKTNALFSGLLGDKPPVSAFEEDEPDPFPPTKQQLKEMAQPNPPPAAAATASAAAASPSSDASDSTTPPAASDAKTADETAPAVDLGGESSATEAAAPAAAAAAPAAAAPAAAAAAAAAPKATASSKRAAKKRGKKQEKKTIFDGGDDE